LVDHIVAGNLAAIAVGHGADVGREQALGFGRRIGAIVIVVEPLGEPARAVPEQRVTSKRETVRLSPGGYRVHPAAVEGLGPKPCARPPRRVLGNGDAAFVANDGGVFGVLDRAPGGAGVPGDGAAAAAALARGERVKARRRRRGRRGCGRRRGPRRDRGGAPFPRSAAAGNRKRGEPGQGFTAGGRKARLHNLAGAMRGTSRWITVAASRYARPA